MSQVWIVRARHHEDVMPSIESVWVSRALAQKHAVECANKMVSGAKMFNEREHHSKKWDRIEVVAAPNSIVVEVRASRGVYTDGHRDWSTLRKWFLEPHTLHGDAVSALAEVAP